MPGCAAKANVRGVEREPGAMQTAFRPLRASSSTTMFAQSRLRFGAALSGCISIHPQRVEHRLELERRLVPFLLWLRVGHNARPGVEPHPLFMADARPDGDGERAIKVVVDPADG